MYDKSPIDYVSVHGGMQRGGRGQGRNSGSRNSKDILKFDGDYDFEEANAKFEKDKIVDELSQKLKISKLLIKITDVGTGRAFGGCLHLTGKNMIAQDGFRRGDGEC